IWTGGLEQRAERILWRPRAGYLGHLDDQCNHVWRKLDPLHEGRRRIQSIRGHEWCRIVQAWGKNSRRLAGLGSMASNDGNFSSWWAAAHRHEHVCFAGHRASGRGALRLRAVPVFVCGVRDWWIAVQHVSWEKSFRRGKRSDSWNRWVTYRRNN